MVTAAEAGERFGIPPEKLETLIEHPKVAELIFIARSNPEATVDSILATVPMLPVLRNSETGDFFLNVSKIEVELEAFRELEVRGDGRQGVAGERALDYPMLRGQLQKVQMQADRRIRLLFAIHDLLTRESQNLRLGDREVELVIGTIEDELKQSGIAV